MVTVDLGGRLRLEQDVGASLLVTHDCDLDKPLSKNNRGPRIERMQFLPLRDLTRLDETRQKLVRAQSIQPPEPVYVGGPVQGVGEEAYGLLSELYYLPAAYFSPTLEEWDHPEAEAGQAHLKASSHQRRIGRIEENQLGLLQRKMAAFWPRFNVQLDA